MQKIKNEKGITLVALVLTVIVLALISIPTIINSQQIVNLKKYTNFKGDIENLTDGVNLVYKNEKDISDIGPKYTGNLNFLLLKQNNKDVKNPNDDDIYYLIDEAKLNEKLTVALGELNKGDANKNYKSSPYYNSSANTFSGNDAYIINNTSKTIYYTDGVNYNGVTYYRTTESYTTIEIKYPQNIANGSWNAEKGVNTPKIEGTGLIPIYFDSSNIEHELTSTSTNEEWNQWYDYKEKIGTGDNTLSRWANAITKDSNGNVTGYFVWIPRYAYKITSGCNTSTAGTIEVKFLQGTSDYDKDENRISKIYPTVTDNAMQDYVIHPSFTDGTDNKFANGEWDKEVSGFWIAKYPAGFQQSEIKISDASLTKALDTTKLATSNINYTQDGGIIALGTANKTDRITFPVFNPLTYVYTSISIGDSYSISREIQNATSFYGLSNVDTHMLKNSEWGAVAYLTQSRYGRNGTEVNANSYNYNNANSKNTYCITGLYSDGTSSSNVTSISSVNAYNTTIGVKGSSTGNITGVYDLNGCAWERTAGYITNNNASLANGKQFTNWTSSTNSYKTISTKYSTVYPYDSNNDNNSDSNIARTSNYNIYKNNSSTRYGDAILETSAIGNNENAWNNDYSRYPYLSRPFFIRTGIYNNIEASGIFYYSYMNGQMNKNAGFRIIII